MNWLHHLYHGDVLLYRAHSLTSVMDAARNVCAQRGQLVLAYQRGSYRFTLAGPLNMVFMDHDILELGEGYEYLRGTPFVADPAQHERKVLRRIADALTHQVKPGLI